MTVEIVALHPNDLPAALDDLAGILHACVHDGASVGFVAPFPLSEARAFWTDAVFPGVRNGGRVLFVARDGTRIVGTVQLVLAGMPNQTHKAEVAKMLVHPSARRRGFGRALMAALIARARAEQRRLLVLDTRSGDPSQRLYETTGFVKAGEIPGFALAPDGSDRTDPTTYMYLALG